MSIVYALRADALLQYDGSNAEAIVVFFETIGANVGGVSNVTILSEANGVLSLELERDGGNSPSMSPVLNTGDWAHASGAAVPDAEFQDKYVRVQ